MLIPAMLKLRRPFYSEIINDIHCTNNISRIETASTASVTKIQLIDEKFNSTMNSSIIASPRCGYVHTTFA